MLKMFTVYQKDRALLGAWYVPAETEDEAIARVSELQTEPPESIDSLFDPKEWRSQLVAEEVLFVQAQYMGNKDHHPVHRTRAMTRKRYTCLQQNSERAGRRA